MLHRCIKLAHSGLLLLSVLMAFSIVHRLDDYRLIGPHHELFVSQTNHSASGAQMADMLRDFARDHRVNVGLMKNDLTHPDGVRHFYLATGDRRAASTRWVREGYPAFGKDLRTVVHTIEEAGTAGPGGFYYVFGGRRQAEQLRAAFTKAGFTVDLEPFMSLRRAYEWFWEGALKWCALLATTTIAALVALGVFLDSRRDALHRELARSARFLALALPIAAVATVASLFAYARLHQIKTFGLVALGIAAVLSLIALLSHVAAHALIGRIRGRWITVGAYSFRVIAISLTFLVAMDALAAWNRLDGLQASRARWESAGDAARITLDGTLGEKLDAEAAYVGHWLHQQDRAGRIIISVRQRLRDFASSHAPSPYGEVLKVNQAYLEHQSVLLASGKRAEASARTVQVLIPPAHRDETARIVAGVTEWVAFMAGLSHSPPPAVVAIAMKGGQALFSYGSGSATIGDPVMTDSVVLVLPKDADLLHDREYASYATLASVVFPQPGVVAAARKDGLMMSYINGVQPIKERAAEEHREVLREFRFLVLDLGLGLALLILSAIGASSTFSAGRAGRSFVRTSLRLIAFEIGIAALVVGWVAWDTALKLDLKRSGIPAQMPPSVSEAVGDATGWEPAVAAAIVVTGVLCSVAVLAVLHKRIGTGETADARPCPATWNLYGRRGDHELRADGSQDLTDRGSDLAARPPGDRASEAQGAAGTKTARR